MENWWQKYKFSTEFISVMDRRLGKREMDCGIFPSDTVKEVLDLRI